MIEWYNHEQYSSDVYIYIYIKSDYYNDIDKHNISV